MVVVLVFLVFVVVFGGWWWWWWKGLARAVGRGRFVFLCQIDAVPKSWWVAFVVLMLVGVWCLELHRAVVLIGVRVLCTLRFVER